MKYRRSTIYDYEVSVKIVIKIIGQIIIINEIIFFKFK